MTSTLGVKGIRVSNPSSSLSSQLGKLAKQAHIEFTGVSDYVWKSPRLIEHETKLELEKLPAYYPNDPKTAELRWKLESKNLTRVFPYLIAVGNLFSVASLFETYLLLLGGKLQDHSGIPLESVKGQGITKLFNYFKSHGVFPNSVPLYEQVQAAIRIRNCLAHASGMLAWSRDDKELRRLQSSGAYLSPEHRDMRKSRGKAFDEILIMKSALGERLQVSNEYSFVVTSYLREYFIALCSVADEKLGALQ